MLILQRLLPLLTALFNLGMLEILFFSEGFDLAFTPLIFVVPLLATILLVYREGSISAVLNSLLLILLFLTSYIVFFLFLEQDIVKHLLNILVTAILFIFFEQLYFFWHRPSQYQVYSLEYTSNLMNLFSAFFLFASAFGLFIFIHASVILLSLLVIGAAFVITWLTMWMHKIEWKRCFIYLLMIALLSGEFFWVLHFLPTSFMVLGFSLTTTLYVFLNLSRWQLTSSIDKKILRRYVLIASTVLILTLGTATWT